MKNKINKKNRIFCVVIISCVVTLSSLLILNKSKDSQSIEKTTKIEKEEVDQTDFSNIKQMIENHKTDEVFLELGKQGFIPNITYSYKKELPHYYISEIEEAVLSKVSENQPIKIVVNINEEWQKNEELNQKKTILVPNIIGKDRFAAMKELEKNEVKNFDFEPLWTDEYKTEGFNKMASNVVCKQSIEGGNYVFPEDKIVIYIYMGTLADEVSLEETNNIK